MKLKQKKNENAITLIALVVTIVVLLILAGISISMVLGNNGLITKAKEAKDAAENADANSDYFFNDYVPSEINRLVYGE